MKKTCLLVGLLILPGVLSGCSTYSNKLDCPYGKGLGCASVTRVNRIIDAGQIDLDEDPSTPSKKVHIYFGQSRLSKLVDIPEKQEKV